MKYHITYYEDRIGIVSVQGEMDSKSIQTIRTQLTNLILQGDLQTIIWDFEKVSFMDSTAIGLVLGRMKELRAVQGSTLILHLSPTMEKIFQMAGLAPFIFRGNVEEALHFVGGKIYG